MAKRILNPRLFGVEKFKFAPPKRRSEGWQAAREQRRLRRAEARAAGTLKQQPRYDGFIVKTDERGATVLVWAGHREYRGAVNERERAAKVAAERDAAIRKADGGQRKMPKKNSSDAGESGVGTRA